MKKFITDNPTLAALIEQVRKLPKMTGEEHLLQAISFSYGNLAMTTNHKPTRAAFRKVWVDIGLAESKFDAWADQHQWWETNKGE